MILKKLLDTSLDSMLLPKGFIRKADNYYRLNASNSILVCINTYVENSAEFGIRICARSKYQGINDYLLSSGLESFTLTKLGYIYGLPFVDDTNRSPITGLRSRHTKKSFYRQIDINNKYLNWLLENVFDNITEEKFFQHQCLISSHNSMLLDPEFARQTPEPFYWNFYLAWHLCLYREAAYIIIDSYNKTKYYGQYSSLNHYNKLASDISISVDDLLEEWYINTNPAEEYRYCSSEEMRPFVEKCSAWRRANEERIISAVTDHLLKRRKIIDQRILELVEISQSTLNSMFATF